VSDKLQNGWVATRLAEVVSAQKGKKPKVLRTSPAGNFVPYLDIHAIEKGEVRQFAEKISSKVATKNDLFVVWDGARSGWVGTGITGAIGSTIMALTPKMVESNYLRYFLTSQFQTINSNTRGTGIPHVDPEIFWNLEVPLAPLNEQRRIMMKVEALLGKVHTCKQRLSKIPGILKRFRQAVLAAACSGRLTADWREENQIVESASELFAKIKTQRQRRYSEECRQSFAVGKRKPKHPDSNERSRNVVGDLPAIPESWGYFRLEELCHLITDGTHKTPQYKVRGVPFLSVKNVRPFLVRDDDIKFISEEEHRWINARCNPEKGDILYTKVGATFGYAAINDRNYPFSIFVSLALIKPVTPFFSSAYAELVMNSDIVFNQARERVSGIGTPDLHLIEIRDFRAPLPPLKEQKEIVRRVEALFAFANQIEVRYAKGKVHVDKITQSILAKAFRGELVPQDPNDESASVLLDRIRRNNIQQQKQKQADKHEK